MIDAIHTENLTKKYGDNEVVKEVNLRIKKGEFYALMGKCMLIDLFQKRQLSIHLKQV